LEIVFWQIKLGGGEINQAGYKKGPAQRVAKGKTAVGFIFIYICALFYFSLSFSFLMTLRPLPFGATKMERVFYFYLNSSDPFQLNSLCEEAARVFFTFFPFRVFPFLFFYYFRWFRIEEVFLIFCLLHFSQRFYRAIKIIKIKLKLERANEKQRKTKMETCTKFCDFN